MILIALVGTMSMNAQMVEIYDGDQLVSRHRVPNGGKVVFEKAPDLALNRKISVWSEFTEKQVTDMKRILQKFSDKPEEQEKIAYWFLREASK